MSTAALPFARSGARGGPLRIDMVTVTLVLAICLLGLVMVTSASISIAGKDGGDPFAFLIRQLTLSFVGAACGMLLFAVRTEVLEKLAVPLLIVAVVLLVMVLIPGLGHVVKGSRRWIHIAGLNFQASEAARVFTLIYVASYAARRESELRAGFRGLAKPLLLVGLVALLMLVEPDMGGATVLFVTGFGLLFLAGAQLRWIPVFAAAGAAALYLLTFKSEYRMRRIMGFLDPWADPNDVGFQLVQSLIAIGRGEWFGVGLGASVQKLFYLPEAHTDFLFAVLAEELGLVGVVLTVALFLALTWRVFYIARLAADAGMKFQSYLAAGFGLWLGVQAFINIGVNMGVLPTKGLTLPLMSYGRSSLIVTLAWLGIVLRVYYEAQGQTRGAASPRAKAPA